MSRKEKSMENQEKTTKDYYTIDLLHIVKTLWRRIWLIALAGMMTAVVGFSIATFAIAPTYSSSVLLYVNNGSISVGGFSITASEITAAQSLVKTYSVMLKNRTTLEMVLDKAGMSDKYSYGEFYGMIKTASVDDTEIMKVTVTCEDAEDAATLANYIADVLPTRINKDLIDGAEMVVVDYAVPNHSKVGPNITKYTAIGLMLGVLISTIIIAVLAAMDGTIRDEEYVIRTCEYPILAKVPNLTGTGGSRYGYYYSYRRRGKNQPKEDEQK